MMDSEWREAPFNESDSYLDEEPTPDRPTPDPSRGEWRMGGEEDPLNQEQESIN